jgi:long-chain acyl-CoA synthetase
VREYATPLTIDVPGGTWRAGGRGRAAAAGPGDAAESAPSANLTDDVAHHAEHSPDRVLFARSTGDGWQDVSAAEFRREVVAVAKGLVAAGIGPGDRVGLLSRTRYEWTLLDYAIWHAGAVTVPLYENASAEQIAWVLSDSGARAVITETLGHATRVAEVRERCPQLRQVWTLADGAVELLQRYGEDLDDREIEQRRSGLSPDSAATIIYTSGTTGQPKGCVLTHGNFLFELEVAVHELHELFEDDASTVLFLPLAHVFARIIQVGAVKTGTRLAHSASMQTVPTDLQELRPTFVLGVPRVFEKVFNSAAQTATAEGRGRVFDLATRTAIRYSQARDGDGDGDRPSVALRLRHALFDRLVYGRLRDSLGGRCRYAVSGGAPLGERLAHFYRGIGLTVLEGWGLTESTAALCVNLPDALQIGTVGRPLPGTTVRVAEDSELLVRGGQVFAGYWNDPERTGEVLDADGWLHTGDLGEIDEQGFVRITGRKKEILVTAGGKNVAPSLLEDLVRAHPLVSQCMVVGDGRPFIAALVTLDPEATAAWARRHGKPEAPARLTRDRDLRAEVQVAVDEANRAVSRAESIRAFTVLPGEWTEEGGQLTPSLKVKRHVVLRECRAQIEALYD